jgi:hypothetical protein
MNKSQLRHHAAAALLSMAAVLTILAGQAIGATDQWYHVHLAHGETKDGFKWNAAAKGPLGQPLRRICVLASVTEPAHEDLPIEAEDATDCAPLTDRKDSVSTELPLGTSEDAAQVLVTVYRPVIRKVVFTFSDKHRRVYHPEIPHGRRETRHGVPAFRFIATTLKKGECVRRVTTYDGHNDVVSSEPGESCGRMGRS